MIYVRDSSNLVPVFEELLAKVSVILDNDFNEIKNAKSISGTAFEKIICDKLNVLSKTTPFENKFEQTTAFAFPDIVAKVLENNWFGIEVKTSKDSWKCFGNSIFESTKVENLENRIYLFFGKISEGLRCRWGRYEACIESINITHSPRYQINMDIIDSPNSSIFAKMSTSYHEFSAMPVITKMSYVRSHKTKELGKNAALWWLPTTDNIDENEQRLIIRMFNELTVTEKKEIRILSLVYFPIIFSSEPNKYESLIKWITANFGVISSSMRDTFSAGGKHLILVKKRYFRISHIYKHVEENSQKIKEILSTTPTNELANFWEIELDPKNDKLQKWIELISVNAPENSSEIKEWLTLLLTTDADTGK